MIVIVSDTESTMANFENLNPDITQINFKQQTNFICFLAIKNSLTNIILKLQILHQIYLDIFFHASDNEKYEDIKKVKHI